MSEYQVTSWRDLPSMVVARDGDGPGAETVKVAMPARFQEAIDEAAMRLGDVSSDAYLAGWDRGAWMPADGPAADVAAAVVAGFEARWDAAAVAAYLDRLAPGATGTDAPA